MFWTTLHTTYKLLKQISFVFVALFLFISCDSLVSKNDSYNLGYKDGYVAGLKAGKEEQQKSIADKNKKVVIDPAKNDIPTIPEFVEDGHTKNDKISVPEKALKVLDFIKANKKAPEGYVGGRHFGNYERRLPERDAAGNKVSYQEWDINPKVDGRNRGPQRLVTGNDGSAWYTPDHYQTFREIK
ncbi:MAG TPA: ribonuclease domain-containing protein [Chitinophagales bacterium]|nr:MAG: hypothetical protein E6Q89_04655 [Bacteroidia bacterium]HMV16067.1 ribonuclease domain-containing protein [Chitinophagales bacterium]HMW12203.1 ribonuclease domain-containing protein [Chitinophagales bacterium]HMX59266.1 ribonuclease domain-containing protein [Chitinophagales bacterium]HMY23181.1 ribonuclease domain-containing protein [Chitinophagales bacterium]